MSGDDTRDGQRPYRVHLLYRFWVDVEAHDEDEAHELAEEAPIEWDDSERLAEFVGGLGAVELDGVLESLRVQRNSYGFPLDEKESELNEEEEEELERSR